MKNQTSEVSYVLVTEKSIFLKPRKSPKPTSLFVNLLRPCRARYLLLLLAICTSLSVFRLGYNSPFISCISNHHDDRIHISRRFENKSEFIELTSTGFLHNGDEFWEQPDGLGYRPCLNFSDIYRRSLISNVRRKRRFLMVVVSGGLNQQKIQIVDAVVIARILEVTLIIPAFQVNPVWGDESEFSDIFDEQHFKETLRNDVHVVSALPSTYLRRRPVPAPITPSSDIDEQWVRTQLQPRLNKYGVMILRRFDSRLSKNLSPDLQKLRCKVAFHALKFRPWIEELGEKLAGRISEGGQPYMALHLRLEKDVWVRTGCNPGLGMESDRVIELERTLHPELLTSRSNLTALDRSMAGLCPLNAVEITRLLNALGAPNDTRIYWAGGVPFGGDKALEPIRSQFPYLSNKWALANDGELNHIKHKSSILAALDYIVSLKSQVFMANHGGNMARYMQGQRAYMGHRKSITVNKKKLVQLFMRKQAKNKEWHERTLIKEMHSNSFGSPLIRSSKSSRDVIAFPVPDCMCINSHSSTNSSLHKSATYVVSQVSL